MKIEDVLKQIADHNGVSVDEVKEDIQKVIENAAANPSEEFRKTFGESKPSVEEFLKATASKTIKRSMN